MAQRQIASEENPGAVQIEPDDITEVGVVGGAVTLPGRPTSQSIFPGIPFQLAARPDVEYVAGGLPEASLAYARSLPQYIDDLTAEQGVHLYERMQRDAQVAGDLNYLKLSVLANGLSLTPVIPKGGDGHDQAREMADFCQSNLDELDTPIVPYLREMMDAVAVGNKVSEIVYRWDGTGSQRRLMLYRLKPKPRDVYAFVVDNRQNVIGLLGALAGRARTVIINASILDPELVPNLIPRRKFAVYAFNPPSSDPRGSSILRPAYDHWYLKQQALLQLMRYLIQFGSPSLIGITAPGAQNRPRFDMNGNPVLATDGGFVEETPEQAMLQQLTEFQSGSALAVPNGADVRALVPQGNSGETILEAIDMHDRQISKAILGQTLATNEGKHQSRAASQTAKSGTDLIIDYVEQTLCTMIRREILMPLIRANFGDDYARQFCPLVTLSKVEEIDFSSVATAIAALTTAGYLAPSQLAPIDAKLGLPERTEQEAGNFGAPAAGDQDPDDDATFSRVAKRLTIPERVLLRKLLRQIGNS